MLDVLCTNEIKFFTFFFCSLPFPRIFSFATKRKKIPINYFTKIFTSVRCLYLDRSCCHGRDHDCCCCRHHLRRHNANCCRCLCHPTQMTYCSHIDCDDFDYYYYYYNYCYCYCNAIVNCRHWANMVAALLCHMLAVDQVPLRNNGRDQHCLDPMCHCVYHQHQHQRNRARPRQMNDDGTNNDDIDVD